MLFSCFFMACNHRFLNLQMCRSYFLKAVCWRHCDQFLHADPKADPGLIVFRCDEVSAASVAIENAFCLCFATMLDLVASVRNLNSILHNRQSNASPNIAIPTMSSQPFFGPKSAASLSSPLHALWPARARQELLPRLRARARSRAIPQHRQCCARSRPARRARADPAA